MTFYDLLDVRGDATELQLKKAYRKQAIRFHPGPSHLLLSIYPP